MARAGGISGSAATLTHVAPPISSPFGSASPIESQRIVAIDVPAGQPPAQVSFLDGIQRYAVEARFGVAPVVRGYVAAAILCRRDSDLEVERCVTEEFLVQVVYGCQIVVTNPTSSRQKLDVLLQLPVGAIPVSVNSPKSFQRSTVTTVHSVGTSEEIFVAAQLLVFWPL